MTLILERPLKSEELTELIKKKDDPEIKEKLILHNLKLVHWVARKYQRQNDPGRELDDLFQEGTVALIQAISDYDPEKGAFVSYLVLCIRGHILRFISDRSRNIRVPIYMINLISRYKKEYDRLTFLLNREPTGTEIANNLDVDLSRINEILKFKEMFFDNTVSLDITIDENENSITLLDVIPDEGPSVEELAGNEVFIRDFKRYFKDKLSDIQYNSIVLYYGLNCPEHTLQEIAEKYNFSGEYIRSERQRALREIRKSSFIRELDDRTIFISGRDYTQPRIRGNRFISSSVERTVLKREKLAEKLYEELKTN